ncbi:MAG: MurR/RpiR family transcriptional regulator [Fusobacteriaceae bacterium]|jgi:DNA-binding MurR/RpiR family transcriptional regulator|nr:MurR/RpiR family transcriptional regulator [Fusobacteriaceae bacterium]
MEIYIINIIKEQYETLTKSFKKMADFVLENLTQIPFFSIKDISNLTGLSSATIIRFTQHFNFKGYPEFQKSIQEIMQKEMTPMKEFKESILQNEEEDSILSNVILDDIEILKKLSNENLNENFNKAYDLIANAGTVYIVSSRSSYSLGYYLYFMLKEFNENIEIITSGVEDYTHKLLHVKENDVLFAISFRVYTEFTYKITQFFKARNLKIISLTDTLTSPFALISDCTLISKKSDRTYSYVGAMAILNALCIRLAKLNRDKTLESLEKLREIAMELKVYL